MVHSQVVPLDVLSAETVSFSRAAPSVERGYRRHGPIARAELPVVLPAADDGRPTMIRFVRRGHHVAADAQRVAAYLSMLVERELGYGKLSKRHSFRNRDGFRRDVDVVAVAQTAYEKDSAVCTPSRLFAVPVARHVGDTAKQYLLRWFRSGLVQPHVEIRTERHRGIKALQVEIQEAQRVVDDYGVTSAVYDSLEAACVLEFEFGGFSLRLGYGKPCYAVNRNRSYLRCASRYASTRGIR